MNWKYVKALLIVLLVAVNCLLGHLVYTSYSETAFTNATTAKGAAEVLKKSGINVSEGMLAVKNDEAKSLVTVYDREDYLLSAAAFLLGEEPIGAFLVPSGIRAENSLGETVFVGNDLSVHYASANVDENDLLGQPIQNEDELRSARAQFASLLGYDKEAFDGVAVLKSGDLYLLTVSQKESGIPLFGYDCTFGISGGKIVYASGRHFFGSFVEGGEAPLLNRTNILLSEKTRGVTGTVDKIRLCYVLYEDTKQHLLRLLPAYAVSYTDGRTSIINALDASLFE